MASFVPPLLEPGNPDAVARWARLVADVINGQLSIGEPISEDTALKPNGVKGHLLGSFVEVTIDTAPGLNASITCTHNLDIPNKVAGGLNVGWVIVRIEHNNTGVGAGSPVSVTYLTGDAVTNNSIDLYFFANNRTVNDANPMVVTLWFFPTTR